MENAIKMYAVKMTTADGGQWFVKEQLDKGPRRPVLFTRNFKDAITTTKQEAENVRAVLEWFYPFGQLTVEYVPTGHPQIIPEYPHDFSYPIEPRPNSLGR